MVRPTSPTVGLWLGDELPTYSRVGAVQTSAIMAVLDIYYALDFFQRLDETHAQATLPNC